MIRMQEHDVIIIGAGLAGLTAGAKLAKEGKKIFLIEQHSKIGGCATTFQRKIEGKQVTFEVGLHEMNGLDDELDPKREYFLDLGVFENVDFIRLPEFYRFINGRIDVVVPFDVSEAIKSLLKVFPKEEIAIKTFFSDICSIFGNINRMMEFSSTSVGEYLEDLTSNEDLKLVLSANLGYYGDDPYTLSLVFFSAPQGSFFKGGGHYIKGGSQSLSDYLGKVIIDNGGKIFRNHLVTKIIIKDNTAIGVKYIKKNQRETLEHQVIGKVTIANAAIPNVVNKLLGKAFLDTEYQHNVNSLEIACSLLCVFLAFSQPPSSIGNKNYSTFIYDKNLTLKDISSIQRSNDYSKKGFVFVDYSIIDSNLTKEGYVGVITTTDYLEHWENLCEDEYQVKKNLVQNVLIERLEKTFPGIREIIIYTEVATPKTIKRYTSNPGSVYGFAQTIEQAGPRIRAIRKPPINNLFFASAWSGVGGFSGAIHAGYTCALKILKDYWKD
ncbi:MAG: phytoene desaturase family protein [Promethearchaeota archaeon]